MSHFKTLGIQEGASKEEIKKAYKLAASKLHPDLHGDDPFFKEQFQKVNEAYNALLQKKERDFSKELDDLEEEVSEFTKNYADSLMPEKRSFFKRFFRKT